MRHTRPDEVRSVEQAVVAGQLDRRREQVKRHGVAAGDPSLAQVLLADAEAVVLEGLGIGGPFAERLQAIGHDEVALDERAQHPRRHQRAGAQQRRSELGETLGPVVLPAGLDQLHLRGHLAAGLLALREEEVELQQVAQPEPLLPTDLDRVALMALLGGAQQRELDDRAIDEPVDAHVAVEGGDERLLGPDVEHGLGPAS